MKKIYSKPTVEQIIIVAEHLMAGSPGVPFGGEAGVVDAEAKPAYYEIVNEDEADDAWDGSWGHK